MLAFARMILETLKEPPTINLETQNFCQFYLLRACWVTWGDTPCSTQAPGLPRRGSDLRPCQACPQGRLSVLGAQAPAGPHEERRHLSQAPRVQWGLSPSGPGSTHLGHDRV